MGGGAYLYIDDFVSSLSDTFLTINLSFKNDNTNDSLNIFFGLNEYSNSLIDSNNFTIVYDTVSFLTFLYSFVDLPDPYIDGIRIYTTINNSVSINSVELRLTNQHFNFGEQEFLLFCLDSNIPRGNVVWIPLQVGNIWEYIEYIPDEGIYSDFQYKIIDSLENESKNSYVIEKWRLNNMVWNKIAIDTIKTDSNNNIIDQNNEFYFYPYNYLWGSDRAEYSDLLGKLVYVTEFYDNLPGLEVDGIAVADVGILNYYHSNTGFPPTYHISLNGTKVNGTIVYGNITDIVENLTIQPKNFYYNKTIQTRLTQVQKLVGKHQKVVGKH